ACPLGPLPLCGGRPLSASSPPSVRLPSPTLFRSALQSKSPVPYRQPTSLLPTSMTPAMPTSPPSRQRAYRSTAALPTLPRHSRRIQLPHTHTARTWQTLLLHSDTTLTTHTCRHTR